MLNLFGRVDSFREKRKTTDPDKESFSHLWVRLVTTQMKRNLTTITLSVRVYIKKNLLETQSRCSI